MGMLSLVKLVNLYIEVDRDVNIDIPVNVKLPNAATGSTFPRVLGCQLGSIEGV